LKEKSMITEEKLWAVSVDATDDLLAMPDRETALRKADEINAVVASLVERFPDNPTMTASVIEYPYGPDDHAEQVAALFADGDFVYEP
jgi:hypothetical protein